MKKKLNLSEIAKHLGVSIATVSNAFNRPDQLSAKLRERVLEESAKLGYTGPNFAARSLRMGESGVIGVVLSDSLSYTFSDPVASQITQGVAEVLLENSKQLLLLASDVQTMEQNSALAFPDGLIIYGAIPEKSMQQIERQGKPIVRVDTFNEDGHCINIDDKQGAFLIANHAFSNSLTDHAKANVAVLGLKLVESTRVCRLQEEDLNVQYQEISQNRLFGYIDAAKANNIDLPIDMVWNVPINNTKNASIAAREALTSSPTPKVLLCMSDIIALAAMKVAKELGLRVPQDLQITGFDDIPEASRCEPSLTTICQQSIEKGRVAANLLLRAVKEEELTAQKIELDTRLVVRDSCPQ